MLTMDWHLSLVCPIGFHDMLRQPIKSHRFLVWLLNQRHLRNEFLWWSWLQMWLLHWTRCSKAVRVFIIWTLEQNKWQINGLPVSHPGLILGMCPANERRRYKVSHWLGTNLESAVLIISQSTSDPVMCHWSWSILVRITLWHHTMTWDNVDLLMKWSYKTYLPVTQVLKSVTINLSPRQGTKPSHKSCNINPLAPGRGSWNLKLVVYNLILRLHTMYL